MTSAQEIARDKSGRIDVTRLDGGTERPADRAARDSSRDGGDADASRERSGRLERAAASSPGADGAADPARERSGRIERPDWEAATIQVDPELLKQRICDLGLKIEGRPLGKVVERFKTELKERGITRLSPSFYLSSEWGVAEGTTAVAIPFYLADERLVRVQEAKGGLVEGQTDHDIIRYLRHEMGHVVNYGYRLYETEEWTLLFGPMARPYHEEYRAVPFSPDFVRHLPGNYAQKHPDEDWAETFAVWMDAGADWKQLYGDAPGAMRKLDYCERTMAAIREKDPLVTDSSLDEDVSTIGLTLEEFYAGGENDISVPRSLDGDLRAIFAPTALSATTEATRMGSGATLIKRNADVLANMVFRWTGVDPAVVKPIVQHMARRGKDLDLAYPLADRDHVLMQLSAFCTTLSMNYVYKGRFIAT
jgi:hypothetical protein